MTGRDPARYDRATRIVHAVWAAAVLSDLAVGFLAMTGPAAVSRAAWVHAHSWIGLAALAASSLWFFRRLTGRRRPPDAIPARFDRLVKGFHFGLFALMVLSAASGVWLGVQSGGFWPMLGLGDADGPGLAAGTIAVLHVAGVCGLALGAAVHIAAAAVHGLVHRDRVLERMWPPW